MPQSAKSITGGVLVPTRTDASCPRQAFSVVEVGHKEVTLGGSESKVKTDAIFKIRALVTRIYMRVMFSGPAP